jgi:hypothetical protein
VAVTAEAIRAAIDTVAQQAGPVTSEQAGCCVLVLDREGVAEQEALTA